MDQYLFLGNQARIMPINLEILSNLHYWSTSVGHVWFVVISLGNIEHHIEYNIVKSQSTSIIFELDENAGPQFCLLTLETIAMESEISCANSKTNSLLIQISISRNLVPFNVFFLMAKSRNFIPAKLSKLS